MSASIAELQAKAKLIRKHIISNTTTAGSGHPTTSLSAVELTVPLFFGGLMRFDPKRPDWAERDRFVLSKGHAAPLLYPLLAESGYFSVDLLPTLRKMGSPLEGHPNKRRLAGVEASTGSLGQGLSIGVGMSLAQKLDKLDARTYVLTGDGELGEGQVWEAVMAAAKFKLDNLVAIVDQNGYQQSGSTADVLDLKPLAPRWQAFGWHAIEIDGHSLAEVIDAYAQCQSHKGRPSVIIGRTRKGHPIIDLLSEKNYHGKPLSKDDAQRALDYIDSLPA